MANLKIYKFDHVVISLSGILSIISRRKQLSSSGREIFTLSAVLPKVFFHLVKELDSRNVHVLLFHRLLLFCARINGADLMAQDDPRIWIDFSLFSTVFGLAGTR